VKTGPAKEKSDNRCEVCKINFKNGKDYESHKRSQEHTDVVMGAAKQYIPK